MLFPDGLMMSTFSQFSAFECGSGQLAHMGPSWHNSGSVQSRRGGESHCAEDEVAAARLRRVKGRERGASAKEEEGEGEG